MTEQDPMHNAATVPPHEEDAAKASRKSRLPVVTPAGEERGMLPGVAMICMYLLLLAMLNAFAAATGKFHAAPTVRYSMLAGCSLIVVGVFGLLRLRRWGWSLVIGACVVLAGGYFYGFSRTHITPYIVQGLFALVFFLYLSRTEVRERLR